MGEPLGFEQFKVQTMAISKCFQNAFYSEVFKPNQLSEDNRSDQLYGINSCVCIFLQLICNSLQHITLIHRGFLRNSLLCNTFFIYSLPRNSCKSHRNTTTSYSEVLTTEQSIREVECCGGRRAISYAIVSRNILIPCRNILIVSYVIVCRNIFLCSLM